MEENTTKKHWYDSTALVIILTIIIFPVGLYGLYKNTKLQPKAKWGIFVVWAIFVIIAGNMPEPNTSNNVGTSSQKSKQFVPDTSVIDNLTQEEQELLKKYHIKIDRFIAPKVNPLMIHKSVMEYIKDDFDRNFLTSVDLSIFDGGENTTFAQFKKDYTSINPRTGKEKKYKDVYRSFKVLNDGTVREEQDGGGGERQVYSSLSSFESDKFIAYTSEIKERMQNEYRYNKQEFDAFSDREYQNRLEKQKQQYINMVQEYESKN